MKEIKWFKEDKKPLLKGVPRRDGSGGGLRLNKGRGGCPPEKQEKFGKGKKLNYEEFSPKKALKLTGNMVIVGAGVYAGTKLIGDL